MVGGVGGLGSKRLELGSKEFESRGQVWIGEVAGVGKLGLGVGSGGVGVGGLGLGQLGSKELGSGGTWGRKS